MTSSPRGAVVLGGFINGLGVVRSLAARGIPVAVVPSQSFDVAQYSRHTVARAPRVDALADPQGLVDLLARREGEWRGWGVVPTNDEALEFLADNAHLLPRTYRLLAPPAEVTRVLTDKRAMTAAARAVGLATPANFGPATREVLGDPKVRYPVLVKPAAGHRFAARFGCKLFLATTPAALETCLQRVAEAAMPCDVVEFVPGPDREIFACCVYINRRGEPGAAVTVRKWRQSPPLFGVARVAEAVPDPAGLRDATVELARRLGHHGITVAEFKRDPRDGEFRFMEVNGRSVIYNELVRRAGLDLAATAWADAVEGRDLPAHTGGPCPRWINLHADLLYSTFYRGAHRLSVRELVAPYRGPWVDAVWRASDPAPAAVLWSRSCRDGLAVLFLGRHRERLLDRSAAVADGHGLSSIPKE